MDKSKNNSRRDFFLKSAALGASAVIAGSSDLLARKSSGAETSSRYGNGPYPADGMAGYSETGPLKRLRFQRRAFGPKDVAIKIHFCGVCHSDIHTIHGDWGKIQYPQVVGHELAGEVVAAGSSVSRFDVGSRVGVGTMVNSCRHCPDCLRGAENYCENGNTQTYGSKDCDGSITQGGYSTFVVVDEDFILHVPDSIDLAEAGPLLCAGITTYSPLRHLECCSWKEGRDRRFRWSGTLGRPVRYEDGSRRDGCDDLAGKRTRRASLWCEGRSYQQRWSRLVNVPESFRFHSGHDSLSARPGQVHSAAQA